ncbi:MAG: hypothetical protein P4M09_08725 [Devosia sp.]|nr:hypothetical protein [Devosia sp.]
MSLRNSLDLIRAVRPEAGHSALQHEIEAERASSLSAAEKKVIATLAAWRQAEGDRSTELAAARYAVWAYFVQRELIGFRRHADVIADLEIPQIVLNGLGEAPQPWFRRRR